MPSHGEAGGRPSGHAEDARLWLNPKGDAVEWVPYSVSYWHNRLLNQSSSASNSTPYEVRSFPFDAGVNHSQFPRETTAYTTLIKTSETTAFIVYSQWLHHHGNEWRAYSLRVRLVNNTAAQ